MGGWILKLQRHDERALHALVHRRLPPLDLGMRAITRLADPAMAIAIALALSLGAVHALAEAGREALFALATSHALVQVVKRAFSRPRPRLPAGIDSLCQPPDRFSFPSGHAAAALSIALPIAADLAWPLGMILILFGCMVGVSRCYLGVHYPGDVAAGWLLAIVAAVAARSVGI